MPPPNNKRSVRFIESTTDQQPPQKRSRPEEKSPPTSSTTTRPSVLRPSSHKVNNRDRDRVNQDELDDIDDWNARDDGDVGTGGLPSQSQLIDAKRKRREQRGGIFDNDNDNDNDDKHHLDEIETSLAKDGVKIEPFHMREEETDGSGYFDGDTYVFRKNVLTEDGEADAWADTLMKDGNGQAADDDDNGPKISIARNRVAAAARKDSTAAQQEDLDDLSKEELYQRIVPLMGDARESIMAAIRRYGTLAKTKFHSKNRRKQQKQPKQQQETNDNDSNNKINAAKSHLDDLTGAANALLLKGEVDIYDRTRQDILRMYPSLSDTADAKPSIATAAIAIAIATSKSQWEYQGNEDHQLHGPYTTEQMIGWVRSGYFVGAQRVKIRTISSVEDQQADEEKVVEPPQPLLSTEEDLMADLMDDDDEEEEESRPVKKAKDARSTMTVKGQWMWSNEIDYQKYL